MNRTTATCITGIRSKTITGIKTHLQRPKKPRGRSLLRGFGLGIFATRLRWRPERNSVVITRCYGSLTTFNILFKNKDDQFRTGAHGSAVGRLNPE